MTDFGQVLAFGAGSLSLGVALTFWIIGALATRHGSSSSGEGCFVTFVCVFALCVAAFFFLVAVGS